MTESTSTALDTAIAMVQAGYAIEPCRIPWDAKRSKKAAPSGLPKGWESRGLRHPDAVRAAWRHRDASGYLVCCGPSRIVVIDLDLKTSDDPAGQEIDGSESWAQAGGPMPNFTVVSQSGGNHLYFAAIDEQGNRTNVLPGVDVRGIGGGVFGPGSAVVDEQGHVVGRFSADQEIVPPGELYPAPLALLRRQDAEKPRGGSGRQRVPKSRVRRYWDTAQAELSETIADAARTGAWDYDTMRDAAAGLVRSFGAEHGQRAWYACFEQAGVTPDGDDEKHIASAVDKFGDVADEVVEDAELPPGDVFLAGGDVDPPAPLTALGGHGAVSPAEQPTGPRWLPLLGEEVWQARPWLGQLRQRALAASTTPDAVLGAYLAMFAASVPHTVRIDTGVRNGLGCTLICAVVGSSGAGKTTSREIAADLAPEGTPAELGMPTGQGLIEAMISSVPNPEYDGTGKPPQIRQQTEHNLLLRVDEGAQFNAANKGTEATIGAVLRSAFSSDMLGTTNADKERYRHIPAGSYNLGFIVNFQRENASEVIAETGTGMAQRFLWFAASAQTILHAPQIEPGSMPVPVDVPAEPTRVTTLARMVDHRGKETYVLTAERGVTERIWSRQLEDAAAYGDYADNPESHWGAVVGKLAGLLALIDGKPMITTDDLALAELIYNGSARLRDELAAHAVEAEAERRSTHAMQKGREAQIQRGYPAAVATMAERIAEYLRCHEGQAAAREVRRGLNANRHPQFDDAVRAALAQELIMEKREGQKIIWLLK